MYPQEAVREIAKSFVCIRVEHDTNPDLVKRYSVGALTDIRLLDPEGKQLEKLVGFTSPTRLVERGHAVLDRLAGKTSTGTCAGRAQRERIEATPEYVESAVKRGVAYLSAAARKGWGESAPGLGPEPIVLFAWASAGLREDDADVDPLLRTVSSAPLASTYQAAFEALALARLDAKRWHERLQAIARFLVESQLANGQWTYGPTSGAPPKLGDNSNTAYAILGLAACRQAGVDVPRGAAERADAWWRSSQNGDGGWGYRADREADSYASMTESGISSLLLSRRILARESTADATLERANAWLAAHYSVVVNDRSAYQQGRRLYHLYALERVASLSAANMLAGHDWFGDGADTLFGDQRDDGSWDDGADTPISNTAFAILFLTRSSAALR
ncbi:MAG: terpene cyclase/mutase family protein [Planctomycetes bacterium]|nr:terpene cyclase/mutase family protein [Planctomycetota bacterium]